MTINQTIMIVIYGESKMSLLAYEVQILSVLSTFQHWNKISETDSIQLKSSGEKSHTHSPKAYICWRLLRDFDHDKTPLD